MTERVKSITIGLARLMRLRRQVNLRIAFICKLSLIIAYY